MTAAEAGGPLRLTTARWFNRRTTAKDSHDGQMAERWSKVLGHTGPYTQFAYGQDYPGTMQRRDLQRAILVCPASMAIGIDVDDPAEYKTTELARYLGREHVRCHLGTGRAVPLPARRPLGAPGGLA